MNNREKKRGNIIDTDNDSNSLHTKVFLLLCAVITLVFVAIGPSAFSSDWVNSSDFHACIEISSSFIAIIAAVACLMYYFGLESRFYLIIGLGFFVCGSEDLVHGIFGFKRLFADSGIDFLRFIPGTYVAGRMTLAIMIIAAPIVEYAVKKTKNIKREAIVFSSIAVIIGGGLTSLAFIIHLPQFIYPDRLISRPVDFISAILFIVAFGLIIKHFRHQRDVFSGSLLICILLNIGGQIYMSFSKQLFDIFFDIAHFANILSYCAPVTGITIQSLQEMKKARQAEYKLRVNEAELRRHRDELKETVEERTKELADSNRELQAGQQQLKAANQQLESEITEREQTSRKLIEAARRVGRGEVAASVLHNVGNVINSVSVQTNSVKEKLVKSKIIDIARTAELLEEHSANLPDFLTKDERGKMLPDYLKDLAQHLAKEQQDLIELIDQLTTHIQHMAEIVHIQQSSGTVSALTEPVCIDELIKDAITINTAGLDRHIVDLKCELQKLPPLILERHKILQIITNLISNAKYAVSAGTQEQGLIIIRTAKISDDRFKVEVSDNGVGISRENLTKIFASGFTTKEKGHGYGLHSAALVAEELGGSLTANSDGPQKGATFILELPFKPAGVKQNA